MELRLRPLGVRDERQARAGHAELAREGFAFLLGFEDGDDWGAYLARLVAFGRGECLPDDWVPAVFLIATVDDALVGRVSIRSELNGALLHHGGHIGYAVRPAYRRHGYATEMLRQGLTIARAAGVDQVLMTCDEDNLASARVIEHHGGVLQDIRNDDSRLKPWRRYWIT